MNILDELFIHIKIYLNYQKDEIDYHIPVRPSDTIYRDEDLEEMSEWEEASLVDYQEIEETPTQRIEPEEVEQKYNEITTFNTIEQPEVEIDQATLVEPVIEQKTAVKPAKKSVAKKKKSKVVVEPMDYMSPEPIVDDTIITIDDHRAQKAEKAKQLYSGGILN